MLAHIQSILIITGGIIITVIIIIITIVIETTKVVIIVDGLDIFLETAGKEITQGTKAIMGTIDIIIGLIQESPVIIVINRDTFLGIAIILHEDLAHIVSNLDIGDMYVQLET